MKIWSALILAPTFLAEGLQEYDVGSCDDLVAITSPITEDTFLSFTSSPISCDSNENMVIRNGADLTLKTALEATNLVNIRFQVEAGSTLFVQLPNLEWQSEETSDDRGGAAVYLAEPFANAFFDEDVTFTDCILPLDGREGGAIANMGGKLVFEKSVSIIGSSYGGGLYNEGDIEFHGEALFQDNINLNDDNNGGGGLQTMGGKITFKTAASFIDNETSDFEDVGAFEGNVYYGGEGGGIHMSTNDPDNIPEMVFEGPVLFSGNKAYSGAGLYVTSSYDLSTVTFQDLVTFEDNQAPTSCGGGVRLSRGTIDFQGGISATGNVAKNGGVLCLADEESVVNIAGAATMTGNTALYQGGAIFNEGNVSMPQDADLTGNSAVTCPSIKNWEGWENAFFVNSYRGTPEAVVEMVGGPTYSGSSLEACYGGDTAETPGGVTVLDSDAADCAALFGAGMTFGGYSYIVFDTRSTSAVQLDVGDGDFEISCAEQSIIFVMGGGELTLSSSASSLVMTNIRLEVSGHTALYVDIPELTMEGITNSPIGGAAHVDRDSSLEFSRDVKFLNNTLAFLTDSFWLEYGGAALFNAGSVKFHQQAYFRGNGQYEIDGEYSSNRDGGAVTNLGDIQFMRKTKFWNNFNERGGSGGAVVNAGSMEFHRRTVWRENSAAERNAEEGSWVYGGHGAGLYNVGPSATTVFHSKALFQDNVGAFRGAAVAANAAEISSTFFPAGINSIIFEQEAYFKDNSFPEKVNGRGPNYGGAGLWAYNGAVIDFQDRAVFRRNLAENGGAIMNGGGTINFASADLLYMDGNVGSETCPDIKNYDTDLDDQENNGEFGDIDDPEAECGYGLCTYLLGEINIGTTETIVGPVPELCEF